MINNEHSVVAEVQSQEGTRSNAFGRTIRGLSFWKMNTATTVCLLLIISLGVWVYLLNAKVNKLIIINDTLAKISRLEFCTFGSLEKRIGKESGELDKQVYSLLGCEQVIKELQK